MASFKTFEEIESWKMSRDLSKLIFNKFSLSKDYPLNDQINRSSGSVMDNIAEGFGRTGNREFVLFLSFSNGSCSELSSQLYRALDRNYISHNEFQDLTEMAERIRKMNNRLIEYLKESDFRGRKFKSREPGI